MTFVASLAPTVSKTSGPNEKYVKQTYDAMSNSNINLEAIAIQISKMPVREQKKFFRLLLNYIDVVRVHQTYPGLKDVVELCYRLADVVNDYYEEQELNQLVFEGM